MTPQHLQQSDQYHEALLHSRMHAVMSYDWGITGVAFDERALVAGQLKLLKCHGFFPDGTPFFVGDRGEDSVEARPLEGAFPAAIETLDLFLAVPNQRDTHSNVGLDPAKAGPAVRFVAQSTTVPVTRRKTRSSFTQNVRTASAPTTRPKPSTNVSVHSTKRRSQRVGGFTGKTRASSAPLAPAAPLEVGTVAAAGASVGSSAPPRARDGAVGRDFFLAMGERGYHACADR